MKRRRLSTILAGGTVALVLLLTFFASSIPPASGESLGAWNQTTSYPGGLEGTDCVAYSGYAYCVGGVFAGNASVISTAYYAQLTSAGVGTWTKTTSYPIKVYDETCVVSGSDIYCLGGDTGNTAPTSSKTASVYFAALSSSGVGSWTQSTNYPAASDDNKCVSQSSYIYCIYGVQFSSGSTTTYYGAIGGSSITWHTGTSYPVLTADAACAATSGYVYCAGSSVGYERDVYSAAITSSGFGTWQNDTATDPFPVQAGYMACVVNSGYVYCVGAGNAETGVYYASVSGGNVGAWTQTIPYPLTFGLAPCVGSGSQIYCIGDGAGGSQVYYDSIQSGSTTTVTVTSTVTTTVTSTTTLPGSTTTSTVTSTTTKTVTSTTTSVSTSTVTSPTTITSTTTSTVTSPTTVTTTATTTKTSTVTSTSTTTTTSVSTTTEPGSTSTVTTTVTSTPSTTTTYTTTTTSTSTATQTETATATTTPTVTTTQTSTVFTGPTTTETSTQTVPTTVTSTSTETTTQSPSTVTSTQTVTSPVTTTSTTTLPVTTVTSTEIETVAGTGPYSLSVFAKTSQGAPVPGTAVALTSSTGAVEQETTGSDGGVVFPNLPGGGTYFVSAVVDGTNLGTQITMSSNAIVVLEPNAVSASTTSSQSGSSSGNPLLSDTAFAGYGLAAAAVLGVALYLARSRKS